MKALGRLARYLLNINTIWGLLILTALVFGAVQHYLPTSTNFPTNVLREGDNAVVVLIRNGKGEPREFRTTVTLAGGTLKHSGGAPTPAGRELSPWQDEGRPQDAALAAERVEILGVSARGDGHVLTWDYSGYGTYEVFAAGQRVAKGRLVTLQTLTDTALDYAQIGFDVALGLVATMVLFLGLMKVGEAAGVVQLVARVFHPVLRLLYPDVPRDHPAMGAILMNVTTTVLGLGNASTPFGLKAIKELETLNPHPGVATNAQVMLLAYNTAGFALIPTSLLAIRKSANCSDPAEIIGTCMIAGGVATLVAVIMARLLGRLPMFSVRAAVRELAEAPAADAAQEAKA